MCVEKNEAIENKDTYICDVTIVGYASEFDRYDQEMATTSNSYNVAYAHDQVADVFRHEDVTNESQTCAHQEAGSCVYNDESNMINATFHKRVTQDEEYESRQS